MYRRHALELVRTTLAADFACQPSDWTSDEVIAVEAREMVGRRRFPFHAKPFGLATMGRGVVISCSADRLAWAEENLSRRTRDDLFAITTLAQIANLVAPDQQRLAGPHMCSICGSDTFRPAEVPAGITLETFGHQQMAEVYCYEGFHHALSYRTDNPSADMIAVAAWRNGQVIGMAGVSADSDYLWQIGIDVVSEFRGIGLGKALVSQATEATFEQGKMPYYVHNISNVRSGNTARSLGFQWAWTESYVRKLVL